MSFEDLPSFIEVIELDEEQKRRSEILNLGQGESEGIVLAEDLKIPFITDDQGPRKICKNKRIPYIGTCAILRRAFIECIIKTKQQLQNLLNKLKEALFVEEWLIDHVLNAEKL